MKRSVLLGLLEKNWKLIEVLCCEILEIPNQRFFDFQKFPKSREPEVIKIRTWLPKKNFFPSSEIILVTWLKLKVALWLFLLWKKKIAIRWLYTLHRWEVPDSTSNSSKEHTWLFLKGKESPFFWGVFLVIIQHLQNNCLLPLPQQALFDMLSG